MSLKKNMIANSVGQIYTILIGIVMVPFYLEYLGAEAYGLVGIFVLMQSWMSLLDMGMTPTLSREVAKVKGSTTEILATFKKLLHSLEIIFIVIGFIVSIAIILFSDWLSIHWLNVENLSIEKVSYSISLMGAMIGLRWLSGLYRSGIMGAEEQVWLNVVNSIIATIKFVGVLLIFHYISTDIEYFFEYQLFIGIIELILLSTKFYKIMGLGRFALYFSKEAVKPILPFAMGIAYTSAMWLLVSQLDKLLLSNILPLKEYGYFALVSVIANAILQVSYPISKAILPRMTSLLQQDKEDEMLKIYRNSTQLMAIFIFSVVAVISLYPYELLYSWTGNQEASQWATNILFWYVLGNGISTIAAFQYYLQFAHGDLKIHIQYYTVTALVSIPLMVWVAYNYGAIGVAISKFALALIPFIIWAPIVHHKFAPNIHKDWIMKDLLPIFIASIALVSIFLVLDLTFNDSRIWIFSTLILIGIVFLLLNSLASIEGRKLILKKLGIK